MPLAEFAALKGALDTGMTVRDLYESFSGARRRETLQVLHDQQAGLAFDLLREACDRRGEDRREKLRQAIPFLQLALKASDKLAAATRWWTVFATDATDRALVDGCHESLWLAAAYRAVGNDSVSVREAAAAAKTLFALREGEEANFGGSHRRGDEWSVAAGHPATPLAGEGTAVHGEIPRTRR
jgi:hypothetical protein